METKINHETVSVTNDFNDIGKQRLQVALEAGKRICICVDCIGHSRAESVEAQYAYWLRELYGERLCENERTAWGFLYYLKTET